MYRIPLLVGVMDTELLKGTLSLLILSLLSRKPMYGYEIAATVHRDTDGAFTWREGSLYPSLHKMQADGLIVGEWEEKETGRKRRYYRITKKGRAALAGEATSLDGVMPGRQPHPGEIRWTSLSITSIRSVEASAARGRFASTFARSCASICWTPRPSTRRPACRRTDALARALEDFGGPEQVRSELEATHGHRLCMAVVIDKAMQWKETTMKAKWLWTTWAYLTTAGVVALELFFSWFVVRFELPKMQKLRADGFISLRGEASDPALAWMFSFLNRLQWTWNTLAWWFVLVLAALWGLFEWRVRGENKPFMRLAALGTLALAMMVVTMITAGSMELPFFIQLPAMNRISTSATIRRMASIHASVSALEQAVDRKDWQAAGVNANQAIREIKELSAAAAWGNETTSRDEQATVDRFQARLMLANEALTEALWAIRDKDEARLKAAMQKFHEKYGPMGQE